MAQPRPLWNELLAIPEILTSGPGMVMAAASAPRGGSRPVLVLPGLVTGDVTTLPLRAYLRSLGHRPHGWGLGINVGMADHIAVGIDRMLTRLAHIHDSPIDIVGWSAGGLLGRLLAQHRSELVGQVISLGSPIRIRHDEHNLGGLVESWAGALFVSTPKSIDVDRIPVPSTTIWTPDDGVVPGRLCRQSVGPKAEAIEVRGTHNGLGTNPAVMYIVADRLAQRPGEWEPFKPPARFGWLFRSIENEDTIASAVSS